MKRLTADQDRFVTGLSESTALQKFKGNRRLDISFGDAARFWGLTEKMKREQLDGKLQEMDQTLFELYLLTANADAETSSGGILMAEDIRTMTYTHRHMLDQFKRHLNLLRRRIE